MLYSGQGRPKKKKHNINSRYILSMYPNSTRRCNKVETLLQGDSECNIQTFRGDRILKIKTHGKHDMKRKP